MYLLRHIALICIGLFAAFAQAEDRGTILSEYWLGIPGNALTGLTTDARYPASPSGVSVLTSFQTSVNTADSYGTRVRGYLYPPVTGAYRFWVAGDDQCELWLSTDDSPATKVLIANTYSWTSPQEWTKYASQQSVEITLQAGNRYYIEALHKEGGGGDSLAVAWAYPGVDRQVIPGEFLAPAAPAPVPGSGTGYVLREWWSGLTGTAVADLTAAPAFPASPTARDYLTTFETPANWGDNYGTRVRGFLRPTQSGTYFFWISGDDGCQLWLSQDAQPAQKGLIASVPGHTATREWTKYPQQKSMAIDLQAGASYYIEALHKEGGGGDIVSVAWSGPGIGDTPTVITGNYLSPSSTENPPTPVGQGSGTILVETWNDIPGNNISALTAHPYFPVRPSARGVLTQFKAPTDSANTYGRRVRGYVCPTITGNYRFWIASDDEGSLRLSTDENSANAVVIASVATWTGAEQWDKYPSQQSAFIPLTGGQRYYIEAVQKEGTGGDNLAVAWVGPSLIKGVIPGAYLAPVIAPIIEGTLEFATSTTITISATGTGGSLRYTTDGTTPTAASTLYTAPFAVTASTVVKAVHVDGNGIAGEVAEQVFLRQGTGTGLAGSYFANEYLGGQPVFRLDPVLQFIWGTTAPISGIPADHFSARWQGEIETQLNEEYTLILRSDDGVRVWLDGALVINDWTYHGATDRTCVLPPGRHTLAIEYMEGAVQAELQMFWQSAHQARKIVPSTQLYPLEGVQGIIPPTSPVSPAYVEVVHGSGASIDATVAGNAFPTNHLDDTIRYFNVPLDPAQPTAVAVSSGAGASLTGDITWAPTNVVGNTETVIRKNDSLLLQFLQAGSLSVTNYSGTYLGPITVSAGQRLPVLFSKAGEFTVRLNSQGVEVATLEVTVVTADLTHTILCEVGFMRGIGIDINPFDAPLTFVGNSQLLVTTEAIAQDLASLHITPLRRGTPRLQARIHGPHGPLVAEQAIDEFTIDNAALHSAAVNAQTGIGTVTLVMRPYIPKQIFTMTMFAHTATFKGGATSLTINSTGGPSTNGEPPMIQKFDTATNETIGIFRFDLEIPENESKYCFRVARIQEEDEVEGGAFLPNSGSIFGVQASLPTSAVSLMLGSHTGGGDGPTTNVNGDVCHVLAFASLIFTEADDYSEDEVNGSSNSETWKARQLGLVTADYCEKGKKGDGNCNAVSYKLNISDPPSYSGLDNQLAALFGGSSKESDCKTCSGSCGGISPALDTGTIPGKYITGISVCSTGDKDTLGDSVGGLIFVSKLDIHGAGDSRGKFPDFAEALKKRKGTVFDPVIQIDHGGDESVNGCSLYGWLGNPDCTTKNKWTFTAVARDIDDPSKNIPTEKGYSIKWKGVPGYGDSSQITLTDVEFPVGRFIPRLEVWFTDPNPREGEAVEPLLVGYAEIHSIVVESSRAANVGGKTPDVGEDTLRGTAFYAQNDAGGQAVDARLSIQGSGGIRGRVSLDGYPQNEYWVTAQDSGDLHQVVTIQDGESARYYLQGYNKPSSSTDDLTVRCEGQALIENCIGCSLFQLGPVNAEWQSTDTEKITSARLEIVVPSGSDGSGEPVESEYALVSSPSPTIEISQASAAVAGGQAVLTFSGIVRDRIADNAPRGSITSGGADIDYVQIYVDGQAVGGQAPVTGADDGGPSLWKQHPYKGTFEATAQVPLSAGIKQVTVKTSKNLANQEGWATASLTLSSRQVEDPGGGVGYVAIHNLYFAEIPSDTLADVVAYYQGNRDPQEWDLQLGESDVATWVFESSAEAQSPVRVRILGVTSLSPAIDSFQAAIDTKVDGSWEEQELLSFIETASESRHFRAVITSDGQGGGGAQTAWTASLQPGITNPSGTYMPAAMRLSTFPYLHEAFKIDLFGTEGPFEESATGNYNYVQGGSKNIITFVPGDDGKIVIITVDPNNGKVIKQIKNAGDNIGAKLKAIQDAQDPKIKKDVRAIQPIIFGFDAKTVMAQTKRYQNLEMSSHAQKNKNRITTNAYSYAKVFGKPLDPAQAARLEKAVTWEVTPKVDSTPGVEFVYDKLDRADPDNSQGLVGVGLGTEGLAGPSPRKVASVAEFPPGENLETRNPSKADRFKVERKVRMTLHGEKMDPEGVQATIDVPIHWYYLKWGQPAVGTEQKGLPWYAYWAKDSGLPVCGFTTKNAQDADFVTRGSALTDADLGAASPLLGLTDPAGNITIYDTAAKGVEVKLKFPHDGNVVRMLSHETVLGTRMKHGDKVISFSINSAVRLKKDAVKSAGAHNVQMTFIHEKNHKLLRDEPELNWREALGLEVGDNTANPKFPATDYGLDDAYDLAEYDEEIFARASGAVPGSPWVSELFQCIVLIDRMPFGNNLVEWVQKNGKYTPRLFRGTSSNPAPKTDGGVKFESLGKVPDAGGVDLKGKEAWVMIVPLVDGEGAASINLQIPEFSYSYPGIGASAPTMENDYSAGGGVWVATP